MNVVQYGLCITLAFVLHAGVAPCTARAEEGPGVAWRSHWPKMHLIEYAVTGALTVGALTIAFTAEPRSSGAQGGLLYDHGTREVLRAESRAGRDRARTVGDVGYWAMMLYPFLDALVTPWIVHGSPEVAWQMFAMNVEAFSVAGLISIVTTRFIGRARPSQRECTRDSDYERFCESKDEFSSFVSGHAAIAAASAGLTCAHHLNQPLYGGGAFDILACGATTALALTTGIARIMNDRHWATDVTAGWLIGGLAGYGLPALLHYQRAPDERGSAGNFLQLRLLPLVAPATFGGTLIGRY